MAYQRDLPSLRVAGIRMVAVAPAITSEPLMQGKTAECPWLNAKDSSEALGRPEERRNGSMVERKRGRCSGLSGREVNHAEEWT